MYFSFLWEPVNLLLTFFLKIFSVTHMACLLFFCSSLYTNFLFFQFSSRLFSFQQLFFLASYLHVGFKFPMTIFSRHQIFLSRLYSPKLPQNPIISFLKPTGCLLQRLKNNLLMANLRNEPSFMYKNRTIILFNIFLKRDKIDHSFI